MLELLSLPIQIQRILIQKETGITQSGQTMLFIQI